MVDDINNCGSSQRRQITEALEGVKVAVLDIIEGRQGSIGKLNPFSSAYQVILLCAMADIAGGVP